MKELFDVLIYKLEKRIDPARVASVIRDVLEMVSTRKHFNVHDVNARLQQAGWREELLDIFTFETILFLLKIDGKENLRKYVDTFDSSLQVDRQEAFSARH